MYGSIIVNDCVAKFLFSIDFTVSIKEFLFVLFGRRSSNGCSVANADVIPFFKICFFSSLIQKINTSIKVSQKYTDDFHDRFWIIDDKKGLFIGTSLNGIGKRYSLIDYLQDSDVANITLRYKQI